MAIALQSDVPVLAASTRAYRSDCVRTGGRHAEEPAVLAPSLVGSTEPGEISDSRPAQPHEGGVRCRRCRT